MSASFLLINLSCVLFAPPAGNAIGAINAKDSKHPQ
jgi:hypothetical protein